MYNYSNLQSNSYSLNNPYNPFPVGTSGINSPYQMSGRQEIIKVNGREGANAYPLNTPNSSVMMLDINQPILYVKISDGAGYCNITTYSISPLEQEAGKPTINTDELEKRIARLEELYESYSVNVTELRQQKPTQSNKQH